MNEKGIAMEKRPVVDKRIIRLEEVMRKDYIPFLGGRPQREKVISLDDVTNLRISLNREQSVEEFVSKL